MIRRFLVFFFCCFYHLGLAQRDSISQKNYALSVSALVPTGNFSSSHYAGGGISINCSLFRPPLVGIRNLAMEVEAGINYYLGKKVMISGYDYKYKNYLQSYIFPGLTYRIKRSVPALHFGPGATRYRKEWRFAWFGDVNYRYQVSERLLVGAGFFYQKQKKADLLWSAFVKAFFSF